MCHMNHESRDIVRVCVCVRACMQPSSSSRPTDRRKTAMSVCPQKNGIVPSPVPHRVKYRCIRAFVQGPVFSSGYVFNTHQESQKYMFSRRHNQRLFLRLCVAYPRLASLLCHTLRILHRPCQAPCAWHPVRPLQTVCRRSCCAWPAAVCHHQLFVCVSSR